MPKTSQTKERDVMMELMMLGASIVGASPAGAQIIARAMAEIEDLRKKVNKPAPNKNKTTSNKKTPKSNKITRR